MKTSFLVALVLVAWVSLAVAADFDVRDEAEFKKIVPPDAKLAKLAGNMKFIEGPVWLAQDGGCLVFSDIPSDELKKWTAKDGLTIFRKPSYNANGNTLDRKGRLISCEHTGRRLSVVVTIHEWRKGERFHRNLDQLETLVDSCDGKK